VQEDLQKTLIPIYICPSRRGVTRIFNDEFGGELVLTDYAGIHPCTKIKNTDAEPMDITPGPTTPSGWAVRTVFDKGDMGSERTPPGNPPPADSPVQNAAYDGAIVRSPWMLDEYDDRLQLASGHFIKGVPHPTKIAKIFDGTSKTLLIAEKHVRFDLYLEGTASDDRGWTDGWDPDTMRCTCIPPLNDSEYNADYTGAPPFQDPPSYYNLVIGSAHTGGFNAVFADGSVHSINYDVDIFVLNSQGTRNGTSMRETSESP